MTRDEYNSTLAGQMGVFRQPLRMMTINEILSGELTAKLSAGGGDILPLALPDDGREVMIDEDLLEPENALMWRRKHIQFRQWVKGDEIDLGFQSMEQTHKSFSVIISVVDSLDQDILKGNPSPVG